MILSNVKTRKSLKLIQKSFTFLIGIYLLSWVIKGLFFSIYIVPSDSMYPTIQKGDYILIFKFPYQFKSPEFYPLSKKTFPFYSKPGLIEPKKDDIWIFSSPINYQKHPSNRTTFVKRLVGLPGDTIYYDKIQLGNKKRSMMAELSSSVVPKQGMAVLLDSANFLPLQRLILRDDSTIQVVSEKKKFIINGEEAIFYVFKNNFYFMMGDDTFATDSRHWGAVPENLLIGRVSYILWRRNDGFIFKPI